MTIVISDFKLESLNSSLTEGVTVLPPLPRRRGDVDVQPVAWTGRLEFDVTTPGGYSVGRVFLELTAEHVAVHYYGNRLALVERKRLRRWLERPKQPLRVGQAAFIMRKGNLLLALDMAPPTLVPGDVSAQFVPAILQG